MGQGVYSHLEESFRTYLGVFWANLSRFNNLLITVNISMFFVSGIVYWVRSGGQIGT